MKERILKRLREHDPLLYQELRENSLKLRISTIHSFCFSLVRRFAPLLGLDPGLEVLTDDATLWESAKYDTLMRIAEGEADPPSYHRLLELVTRDQVQGWPKLSQSLNLLFENRTAILRSRVASIDQVKLRQIAQGLRDDPLGKKLIPEFERLFPDDLSPEDLQTVYQILEENRDCYLTNNGCPRKQRCTPEQRLFNARLAEYRRYILTALYYQQFGQTFTLFRDRFLNAYESAKLEKGQVDYDDMELLALQLLTEHEEWQNILYAFDEQTDHLLVDEFQDTSFLQWGIIDKLTEEWRSGAGAKTELGIEPTIFIVGDDKQSIYMFRGANVEVFAHASTKLSEWLGPNRLERLEPRENYRSLQTIIDFNNGLFSKLMAAPPEAPPWQTRYLPFERRRNNDAPGLVEIILDRFEGKADECRTREAEIICRRIRQFVNSESPFLVYERQVDKSETARPCRFSDIAILIRHRTNLPHLEQALRQAGIPFLILGGTGFYQEPEVQYAIQLLRFLVDPSDDLALYTTLRGPLFNIPERELLLANQGTGISFWSRLQQPGANCQQLADAVVQLSDWLGLVTYQPLSAILNRAFQEQQLWQRCWEPQRQANLRKFLALIEEKETTGIHPLRIIAELEQAGDTESKADVRTEGQNAVQILTVHAAKGLQFPIVIHPGLNRELLRNKKSGEALVIEETAPEEVLVSHIPDSEVRRHNELHQTHLEKQLEEEKRIFYVACTRAQDALILTGTWNDKTLQDTPLAWLRDYLGLKETETGFTTDVTIAGLVCLRSEEVPEPPPVTLEQPKPKEPGRQLITKVKPLPRRIRQITRNIPKDYRHPSPEWLGLGDVIHALLQWISEQPAMPNNVAIEKEAERLLLVHGLNPAGIRQVMEQLSRLNQHPEIRAVIMPRPDARSEMPVMAYIGGTLYTGRIDRVIITDKEIF
ncbi:MAG: 3'-5' exonuclease, partial [candidate division WOR-3 bacterium]